MRTLLSAGANQQPQKVSISNSIGIPLAPEKGELCDGLFAGFLCELRHALGALNPR